jgi:hypothetical protein
MQQVRAWMLSQEGLERIRRTLPEGATLEDALTFHRKLKQLRRQPSRCMRTWEDEGDDGRGADGATSLSDATQSLGHTDSGDADAAPAGVSLSETKPPDGVSLSGTKPPDGVSLSGTKPHE